jgi:Ca2+-binding RTX toxin-like protein
VLRGGSARDVLKAGDEGDTLVGGAGPDDINGGGGDDDISAADGEIDHITCGAGYDTVSADPTDEIAVPTDPTAAPECEEVTVAAAADPSPAPTPAPQPTPDPVVITDTSVVFVPVLGSIAPVLAPGPANAADLTPPGAAMRSANRQRVGTILKRGGRVPVRVTCQEACGISVALSVDRTTAKRLKLDSRTSPVVIGTASAKRALAGSSVLRVKLTSKAKAGLKTAKRNTIVTTQVLVSDASGNGTLLSRHITLVR